MEGSEGSTSPSNEVFSSIRPYGVVDAYMRHRVPPDMHPSYRLIRTLSGTLDDEDPEPGRVSRRTTAENDEQELSLEEIYKDAEGSREAFRLAMQEYERTADAKYKTGISTSSQHTWEEVLAVVATASEKYKNPAGLWGKIRGGLRKFGRGNEAFTAWATLLPSQSEYFSLLCGGIKLIIGAAARLENLREDISKSLAEIPELLSCTQAALGVFKKSQKLHECSAALYVATIAALQHIVYYYNQKAAKKFATTIFKQKGYEQQLSEKLEAVKDCAERFRSCATVYSYMVQEDTRQGVKSLHTENQRARLEAREDHDGLNEHVGIVRDEQFKQFCFLGSTMEREADVTRQFMNDRLSRLEGIVTDLSSLFSSDTRMDYRSQDLAPPTIPIRRVVSESALIKERIAIRRQVLSNLTYDPAVTLSDLETNLRSIWRFPRPTQDRAMAIMTSPKLHQWITSPTSSALWINGNHPTTASRYPTSFVCAKLVDSVQLDPHTGRRRRATLALSFFCNGHTRASDPETGVTGMMRNLVAQLLDGYPDVKSLPIQPLREADYNDISDLCDIFDIMMAYLPRDYIVFCIVDGMSYYEESASRRADADKALEKLSEISSRTDEDGCAFKLLLTAPRVSRGLQRHLPKEDVLTLPHKIPPQGNFTNTKWAAGMRRLSPAGD